MSTGRGAKLGLVLGTTAFTVLLAEAATRLWVPVRNVGPSFTTYDETYGKRLKPGFHATRRTPEFTMRFTTNSHGFRGPELDGSAERPLVFLGDSYTMGYGVDDGEEFPALVRATLRRRGLPIPVVNAAVGDDGNGRWVKFLRGEGSSFRPRLVVLQISGNDFEDNLREGLFSLDESGALIENPVPEPGWPRVVQGFIEAVPGLANSYLVGLSRQALSRPGATPHPSDAAALQHRRALEDNLTFRLLETTLDLCTDRRWPVLGVSVGVEEPRLSLLRGLLRRHGADLLVISPHTERPDLYYQIDRHWHERGHQWVAQQLLEHLDSLGLLRP